MHEIILILADLYLPEASDEVASSGIALPGLEHVVRFSRRAVLEDGWRAWLARHLGQKELAKAAPGTVAAIAWSAAGTGADPHDADGGTAVSGEADSGEAAGRGAVGDESVSGFDQTAWIATPVHLIAGLTSLHLDRRSLLRLPAAELSALATDFRQLFQTSGFRLEPLQSGDFLLLGPRMSPAEASEPARSLGGSIADALPAGMGAGPLRKLGAEIEMWLHDHPVNRARTSRGLPPVSALWVWGGGSVDAVRPTDAASLEGTARPEGTERRKDAARTAHKALPLAAFGSDAYLLGLWAAMGGEVQPLPQQLAEVIGYPDTSPAGAAVVLQTPAARQTPPHDSGAVLTIEISPMLHSSPTRTLFDALSEVDQRFTTPAVQALHRGEIDRLHLLANDQHWMLQARDRFKRWRRPLSGRSVAGLAGLE